MKLQMRKLMTMEFFELDSFTPCSELGILMSMRSTARIVDPTPTISWTAVSGFIFTVIMMCTMEDAARISGPHLDMFQYYQPST